MEKMESKTWAKFRQYCRVRHNPPLSPSTIEESIRKLRYLEKNGIDLINLDPEEVYDFFNKKFEEGAENTAINHYVKALNRWVKFLGLDIHFQRYREYEKPIKVPTVEEVNAMIGVYNKRTREHPFKTHGACNACKYWFEKQ